MSPWWPLPGLLSRCSISESSYCNSFVDTFELNTPLNDKRLAGSFFIYYIMLKSYKYFYIYFRAPSGKVLTALPEIALEHYNDVITSTMASQITSLTLVYSTVYSRGRLKKTSKLRVTGLCEGNSPVTGEFPAQRARKVENVGI